MFKKIGSGIFKRNKDHKKHTPIRKKTSFFGNESTSFFIKRKKKSSVLNIYKNISIKYKRDKLLFIGFFTLLGVCICIFLFSSVLKVKNIYIYREDSIINIDQAYGNIEYVRGKNILLLDTNEIAQRLQKSQKSISSIKFDTQFPNHLNINIGSYSAMFQTEAYLILSNGVVIPKDSRKHLEVPFIQVSKDIEDYALFGNTLNIESLKNIHKLIEEGKKNILGFDFKKIRYYIAEKELLLMHNSGTILIFDLNNDIPTQVRKLAVYTTEKGNISEKKYVYIDVRIPEKLFLCGLEAEYDCKKSIEYIYGESTFDQLLQESFEPLQ